MSSDAQAITSLEWRILAMQWLRILPSVLIVSYIVWRWMTLKGYAALIKGWLF